jgi:hypothetical protein
VKLSVSKIYQSIAMMIIKADTYSGRLIKYIPSEIIALYLGLEGILKSENQPLIWLHCVAFKIYDEAEKLGRKVNNKMVIACCLVSLSNRKRDLKIKKKLLKSLLQ